MIYLSTSLLILLLAVLTLLGFVVGCCTALIYSRVVSSRVDGSATAQLPQSVDVGVMHHPDRAQAENDIHDKSEASGNVLRVTKSYRRGIKALSRRESVLKRQLQSQAQHVTRLETHILNLRSLQVSLSQNSRPYYSKRLELQEKTPLIKKLSVGELPILSRRVGKAESSVPEAVAINRISAREPLGHLSIEADSSALAESESSHKSEDWRMASLDRNVIDRAGRRG